MAATVQFTADMVRDLNDRHNWRWPRYETVHGELLMSPAPRAWHQEVAARILVAVRAYLQGEPVGNAFTSPADISWAPKVLVQPDVFVVRMDEVRTWDWARMKHLLLTVEVLSPSSTRADRVVKRQLYQEQGVGVYWVVDADARAVEVWTPQAREAHIEREVIAWHPHGASVPFMLPLTELFRPV